MYLQEFRLNTVMKSPFRRDRSPSFSVGTSTSGRLYWRDYSTDEKGGPVDMVQKMYGLTYPQALQKIAQDFGLLVADGLQYNKIVSSYQQPVIEKQDTLIHVTAAKWTKKALQYWEAYGIDQQQLQKEDIHNVSEWFLNRKRQEIKSGENVFAYRFEGDLFKMYMPDRTRQEGRWKTNVSCSKIENLEGLNGHPKVVLTKSRKDRLTLSNLLPEDIWVINSQNEGTSGITPDLIKRLEGKDIRVSFDADDTGVRNCKKICDSYGYKYVNTPRYLLEKGVKDWSDWYKLDGHAENIKSFLQEKQVI